MPTVYLETYGCQMNVADTEMVLGLLDRAGYTRAHDPAQADVILLNTCAVRERAVERVLGRASSLARHKANGRHAVLGITGCLAEHLGGTLRTQAPYLDLVVGPDSYRRLPENIERARAGEVVLDTELDTRETYVGLDTAPRTGSTVGHVAIQRGCNRFCSFCVVPFTRGRERAISPAEVVRQVRALAASGCREVQLLGQTVNSYRATEGEGVVGFAELLRRVADVEGLARIRFLSPYPLGFTADVIAAMAELPKVCRHVHLPLQSASDTVLARMNRGYTFAAYRALVERLRAALPELAITTDVLVGFSGESDAEYAETLAALAALRFDNAFMFAYSERKGTAAACGLADDVPAEVKQRRLARVIEEQRHITAEGYAERVGRRERVLLESPSRRSPAELLGRTDGFRPIIVPSGPGVGVGSLLDVMVERSGPGTLYGRAVTEAHTL